MEDNQAHMAPTRSQLYKREYGYFIKNLQDISENPEFLKFLKKFLKNYSSRDNSNSREGILWSFYTQIKEHHHSPIPIEENKSQDSESSKNLENLTSNSEEDFTKEIMFKNFLVAHASQYKKFAELRDFLEKQKTELYSSRD